MRVGPLVRLANVHAGYRRHLRQRPVLHDVSWMARPGEVTALVGPNGVGKTTTFRLLLGVLAPRRGTVSVGAHRPGTYRIRHGVGFLPERRSRLPGWTVSALVRAGCALAGGGPDHPAICMEELGLTALGGRTVDSLSRGEARATLLAFALAGDPGLVLLDEPWSGLDPGARDRLRSRLAHLRARQRTVVVSSHELLEVARVADRIVVMANGTVARAVARGTLGPEALERAVTRTFG